MYNYIQRLILCGYSPSDAYSTCYNFIKELTLTELDFFVRSLEKEIRNVDPI